MCMEILCLRKNKFSKKIIVGNTVNIKFLVQIGEVFILNGPLPMWKKLKNFQDSNTN